jgi:hypothetical protein
MQRLYQKLVTKRWTQLKLTKKSIVNKSEVDIIGCQDWESMREREREREKESETERERERVEGVKRLK